MNETVDVIRFGPQRDGALDFTLLFEQSILTLLPSAIFLISSTARTSWLLRKETCVRAGWLLWSKLGIAMVLFCIQLSLLALWALPDTLRTEASLAAAVIALVNSCIIGVLVYVEHKRSVRPSILLEAYLALSALLDIAQARSLFLQPPDGDSQVLGKLFLAALVAKIVLVFLEEFPKRTLFASNVRSGDIAREATSGLINRTVFWWLNRLFLKGFRGMLRAGDLGNIDSKFESGLLLSILEHKWKASNRKGKHALLVSTLSAFRVAFLAPVIPRLCLTGFSFSQPFLINGIIDFVGGPNKENMNETARMLIGATALIYIGLAVTHVLYDHLVYQLITILRGGLASLIFQKSLRLDTKETKENDAVTLMSTDIEGIASGIKGLHEIWVSIIELALAVYLLARQVGPACFLVIIPAMTNLSDQMTPAVVISAGVFWTRSDLFTVGQAFTSLSIVALVAGPIANLLGSYPTFVSCFACFTRIQEFLLLNERDDRRTGPISETFEGGERDSSPQSTPGATEGIYMESPHISSSVTIAIDSVTVKTRNETASVLENISLSAKKSSCTMLVGPVGSGKSSLLKVILGELPPSTGTVQIEKVGSSISYCDQTAWLRNVSVRDNIIAYEKPEDMWYQSVLHACALRPDISRFPQGDQTIVGSGGITLSGGQKQRVALARALYARKDIVLLDDVFSALDNATAKAVFSRTLGPEGLLRTQNATVILATNAVHQLVHADHIIVLGKNGSICQSGTFSELQTQDGYVKALAIEAQGSSEPNNTEEETAVVSAPEYNRPPAPGHDDMTRQTGDLSLYKFYLKSAGTSFIIIFLLLAVGYVSAGRMAVVWVRIWTEHGTDKDVGAYFAGYLSFCLGTVVMSGLMPWFSMCVLVPKSATHLHQLLLGTVMKAPLWFFALTDNGVTLNRFSQDMDLVGQTLPIAFFTTVNDTLEVVAGAVLIALGAKYVAAIIPLCLLPVYLIQKFYLRTSRQLRHLDLEAKSPLYTHFTETLAGIVTIRAMGWKDNFLEDSIRLLNFSQRPYYLMFCIQRWLAVVVNLFVAGIALVLVAIAVWFTNTTSRGAIGLAMVNLIYFNSSLSRLIHSWTNMETSLGAIARLRDFLQETPQEDHGISLAHPPEDWPSDGAIETKSLTSTYQPGGETVLQDVSLAIYPGQKVGICGRTGSGKSSLLLSLLRLLEVQSGSIRIDGHDISSISSAAMRSHFTTIPQDPVVLPGTVRDNLDPLQEASDDELLVSALSKVGLWELICERGGLEVSFDALGLSHGQQQLFSLARSLLHKSRVLLLDEATSSLDKQTDLEVHRVLRHEFKDSTVLVVAHRMETIADMDVVVVMDKGRVAEVGDPRELMAAPESLFKRLWEGRHG
ncbi:putative multidrug resistance protein MDR [Thozetella sp. PMI_491]|nr:putative multidrug resistance protein MDR [Thozetella sp. PMI_491]